MRDDFLKFPSSDENRHKVRRAKESKSRPKGKGDAWILVEFSDPSNAVMSQILRRYPDTFLKEVAEIDFLTSFPRRGCTDMLLLPPKPHSRRPSAPSDCNNGRALGRTKSFNGIDEAATPQKGLQRATRKAGPACTLAPASCLSAMDISEREDSEWVFLDLFGRASQEETKVPRRSSLAFRAALKELWCSGGVEKVYRECLSNSLSHHNSKQ